MVRNDMDGAFHDFVVTEGPALYRLALLLSADQAAAHDLVQTTMLRTWKAWSRVSAADDQGAYVRRILVNAARSGWRRRWRHESPTGSVAAPTSDSDGYQRVEDREQLVGVLRRLPPRQRAAVALRYLCDLEDKAIADMLGCSETTVRSQISRALAKLRITYPDPVPRAPRPESPQERS
jgi:RNA polymerase sigma-70 factor (sigma-E family)